MAEFALGLTKTAVEGTVSLVKSAVEEETKLRETVQKDLVFISDEFEMMQSFLRVANRERAKNEVVVTWVRQLRNLAFDVEDCVELVVHLEIKSRWRAWLQRMWYRVYCCGPPMPLDVAIAEIKQLKARVEDVSQRNIRYNLISDSGSKSEGVSLVEEPTDGGPSAFHVLREVWDDAGKLRGKVDLPDLIVHPYWDHQVISLWGSRGGDPETTSILRRLYCDDRICQQFKNRAWINLKNCSWVKLMQPFNSDEFLRCLLTQFYASSGQHNEAVDLKKRCLIILEEVSTVVEWEAIKMCLSGSQINGSQIVVSTKQLGIARLCTGEPNIVSELRQFSDGQFLCALCKKGPAFSRGTEKPYERDMNFQLVGRQKETRELASYLIQFRVVAVWGIAGVGKSCLVRDMYYRLMHNGYTGDFAQNMKFEKYSWVDVPHPFSLTELSRRLLLDFHSHNLQAKEGVAVDIMEGQDSIQSCRMLLSQESCLVVFDGLRSTHDWDQIKAAFLPGCTISCIVVITYDEEVANHCVKEEDRSYKPTVNIKGLKPNLAFDLFKQVAWVNQPRTEYYMKHSTLIMTKCGGLPKLIDVVGKCMVKDEYSTIKSWKSACDVIKFLEKDHRTSDLVCWMQSYFDACPDSLKPCIFYLSVFSAEHNIRRSRLLRRWLTEGYSRNSSSKSAEKNVEDLFFQLVKLSIIQEQGKPVIPPQNKRKKKGKSLMCHNAFFHEYIISRPMEDNLVFALEGRRDRGLQHSGKHLTIRKSWHRDETVFQRIDFSQLRSLTVFGDWKSFLINESMKILRVLDLEDTSGVTNDDLEDILKILTRLKFLSLRGCRHVSRLPKSLGGLRQLQFLDVKHTSIVEMPTAIITLQKLQYVRAGTTKSWNEGGRIDVLAAGDEYIPPPPEDSATSLSPPPTGKASWCGPGTLVSKFCGCRHDDDGVKVPVGIRKVKALHNLGVVNVSGAGGKAILKELKYLTKLRKLRVPGINRKKWQELCSAISDHLDLKSLSVRFSEDCLEEKQKLPNNLRILKLSGRISKLPEWIAERYKDLRLAVEMTTSSQQDIDDLAASDTKGMLSNLSVKPTQESLSFHQSEMCLELIRIDCTSTLQQVTFGPWSVTRLMFNCFGGSPLDVSGVEKLESLKEVWLMGSYGDELVRDLQGQLGNHRGRGSGEYRVKPILKLVRAATSLPAY